MERRLRFKHHLRVEPLDAQRVFLIGERDRFLIEGHAQGLIAPLLDGTRTTREVIFALSDRLSAAEVYHTVTLLEERGYLTAAPASVGRAAAALWESSGVDGPVAEERLAATGVGAHALDGLRAEPLSAALCAAGVRVETEAQVHVVLAGDPLSEEIAPWSRTLPPGARWMTVCPGGLLCTFGPLFGAEGGPCPECLAARLRRNRPVEHYLRERRGGAMPSPPRAGNDASVNACLHLAALALARWIVAGGRGEIDAHLLSFDAASLHVERHTAVRRPQCPRCGDPTLVAERAGAPVELVSRRKRHVEDGGHRCAPPAETYERLRHHVSPLTGVVADLRPHRGEGPESTVWHSVFRLRPGTDGPGYMQFHQLASGKGRSAAQARTGALCEAIERYSAVAQGDERRVRARRSELGDDAVHPHLLMGFSERQYRERPSSGPPLDPRRDVPPPYDGDAAIDWTPVWSLTHGRLRYVPMSYGYLCAPVPPGERFCLFSSNGNAAGTCVEEAVVQGFFEICERDAVAVWWYNRLRRPGVDLASFADSFFEGAAARLQASGLQVWALDLTHDLEIPVFAALGHDPTSGDVWMGCGCHFEPELALQRSLTELVQTRSRKAPWNERRMERPDYLFPAGGEPLRAAGAWPCERREDLRDDVLDAVARSAKVGLEVLVLDQTRPDIGLSAVKVIVPGARHFWPRLGPGRLFDVPRRMGWHGAGDEAGLNPVPCLF
jgi:oxazoline/thiazoline synthase